MFSLGIQTEELNETFTCPICFEDIEPFNCVKLPNCSHRYCSECFLENCNSKAKSRYNCALCRDQFIRDDLKRDLLKKNHELEWDLKIKRNTLKCKKIELEKTLEMLDQYADELFFYQQELPYLHLLNTNFEEFMKQKKRRDKLKILKGNKIWRKNMKNVFNELFSLSGWIEDEEGLEDQLNPYIDEIDLSGFSKKIFEEDETGYKIVYHICNENPNSYDTEEDDSDLDSMPSLVSITSDEEDEEIDEERRIEYNRRIYETTRNSWLYHQARNNWLYPTSDDIEEERRERRRINYNRRIMETTRNGWEYGRARNNLLNPPSDEDE